MAAGKRLDQSTEVGTHPAARLARAAGTAYLRGMPDSLLTPEVLAELAGLARAATPGPWDILCDPALACTWMSAADGAIALFDYRTAEENAANALFAAVARERVPELVVEVLALRTRVRELLEANSREVERRIEAQRQRDRAQARLP
jgi:hypothetical protein